MSNKKDEENNNEVLLLQENKLLKEKLNSLEEKYRQLEFVLNSKTNNSDNKNTILDSNINKDTVINYSESLSKQNNFSDDFENLFMNAPAGIAVLEMPEYIYTFANPVYESIIGKKNITGKKLKELVPEIEGQGFIPLLDQVFNTGIPYFGNEMPAQLNVDNNDNLKTFYFNFIFQPVYNSENNIIGVSMFCFDVTLQVLARQDAQNLNVKLEEINSKLEKNEKYLEDRFNDKTDDLVRERKTLYDLFTNAPAFICIFKGSNHEYEFVNPEYQKLYGYRDLTGKTVREAHPELEGQVFFDLLDNVYTTGEPFVGNEILAQIDPYQNGNLEDIYFNFIYQPTFNKKNEVDGIMVFAFDITEQVKGRKFAEDLNQNLLRSETEHKELSEYLEKVVLKRTNELLKEQEALKAVENEFEILSENIPNLLWTAKPDGGVDYFNKKFLEFVGLSLDEVKDWGWKMFVHPDDIEETIKIWENSLKTGNLYEVEYRFKKAEDKQYYWFIGRALPLYDENRNIIKWFGVCTDINQLKLTEHQLENANHELERFNYIASHDLQSPIRTVVSYSKLLQKRYGNNFDSGANELFDIIIKASLTMKNLIDDLLSFSKIGKEEIIFKEVDLNYLIHEIVTANKEYIKEKNATINYFSLPVISAEPIHIFQIFQNLISNAIKYQRPNSRPIININAERKYTYWQFKVSDNGIGIEEQYFERIFEPFKRLHSNDEYTGSGIGLATVKKIIEMYGGKIWLDSNAGRGSTFYFTIPFN